MGRRRQAGEIGIALGVVGFALFFAAGSLSIEVAPSYARIGPRVFPFLVAAGLFAAGLVLVGQAWRAHPAEAGIRPDVAAFLWISAGLVVHLLLVKPAGFVVASTVLFVCAARGFGSRSLGRDGAIGAAFSIVVYQGFTRGLGLQLPGGPLAEMF